MFGHLWCARPRGEPVQQDLHPRQVECIERVGAAQHDATGTALSCAAPQSPGQTHAGRPSPSGIRSKRTVEWPVRMSSTCGTAVPWPASTRWPGGAGGLADMIAGGSGVRAGAVGSENPPSDVSRLGRDDLQAILIR